MSSTPKNRLSRRALLAGAALSAASTRVARAQARTPERPRTAPPQATPPGTDAAGNVFAEMLALAPDILARPQRPSQFAQFGDIALQVSTLGRAQPESVDDPAIEGWIPATQWIALPPSVQTRGGNPEFRELFGFDLFQVDQGLIVDEPPNLLTFLRGRFDENELRTAWTGAGYQQIDEGGAAVFSLAEEPEVDLQNPVHQLVLAQFNNATILADGTLAFAPSLESMRAVLAVAEGQEPSLADHDQVTALLSTVEPSLASALLLDGESLALGPIFDPRMTPAMIEQTMDELEQSGEMPPSKLALFGVTPGGPLPVPIEEPDATPEAMDNPAYWVIRLLMASAASAETAAATIPNRIATLDSLVRQQPYAEMLTVRRSEALGEPPVVALDLDFVAGEVLPAIWQQAVFQRDLLFLAS